MLGIVVLILIVFGVFKSTNSNDNDGPKIDQNVIDTTAVAIDTTAVAVDSISAPISDDSAQTMKKETAQTIEFFNHTDATIALAYASFNDGVWGSHGWFIIEPHNSATITLPNSFSDDSIYWYAKDQGGYSEWKGSDKAFCIDPTNKFDYLGSDSQNCSNSTVKTFNKLIVTDTYTLQSLID